LRRKPGWSRPPRPPPIRFGPAPIAGLKRRFGHCFAQDAKRRIVLTWA